MQMDDRRRKYLAYRYLSILEDEGNLNAVAFDKPELDGDPEARYTKEYHGVKKLMEMVPDDVLIRQFGEYECFIDDTEEEYVPEEFLK